MGVYYGNGNTLSTKDVAAMRISNNGKPGIILTDNFFDSCTIEAVNILIHEMALSRNTHPVFHVFQEKECKPQGDTESELTTQLDNISENYASTVNNLTEDDIDIHNYFALIPLEHDKFINLFKDDLTIKEYTITHNQDSISHLAIAIGNYAFKKNNTMPLNSIAFYRV